MAKLLDENGLAYFWGKVKAAIPTKTSQLTNDSSYITADSPALTGTPTAPTAAVGTDSTQIATTAFVQTAIGEGGSVESITNAEIDSVFPFKTVSWADGTDEEIVAMVEAADAGEINLADYWAVGDVRSVNLSAMSATGVGESHEAQTVEFVLMDTTCKGFTITATGKKPSFIAGMKNCLTTGGYMNSNAGSKNGWSGCARRTWCNNVFYNAVPSTLRSIFKQFTWQQGIGGGATSGLLTTQDYFGLAPEKAIFGSRKYSQTDEAALYSQWNWYATLINRIKIRYGSTAIWWGCSPYPDDSDFFCAVDGSGGAFCRDAFAPSGLAPFGCI